MELGQWILDPKTLFHPVPGSQRQVTLSLTIQSSATPTDEFWNECQGLRYLHCCLPLSVPLFVTPATFSGYCGEGSKDPGKVSPTENEGFFPRFSDHCVNFFLGQLDD